MGVLTVSNLANAVYPMSFGWPMDGEMTGTMVSKKDSDFEHAASCIRHWPKARRGIEDLRRIGVQSFGQLGEKLPRLKVSLRRVAIWIMHHSRSSPEVVPILLELLQDSRVARGAANALELTLHRLEESKYRWAFDVLRGLMLEAADPVVRQSAVEATPRWWGHPVLESLVEVATKSAEHSQLRAVATRRIGTILERMARRSQRFERAAKALLILLGEQDRDVRQAVAWALASARVDAALPKLRKLLGGKRASRAARHGVDPRFDRAAQRMIDKSHYLHDPGSAVRQLAALHEAGIHSLTKLKAELPTMSKDLRVASIRLLEHADKRIAVPLLVKLLRDPEVTWECSLVRSLCDSCSQRVCSEVVKVMLETESAEVRQCAIRALPYKFAKNLIEPLLEVATNVEETAAVRGDAIEKIGVFVEDSRSPGFRRAAKTITELLRDKAVDVRFWSCYALGAMRVKSAIPALRRVTRYDKGFYRGMRRSMKEEAAGAIVAISSGRWPDSEEEVFGTSFP